MRRTPFALLFLIAACQAPGAIAPAPSPTPAASASPSQAPAASPAPSASPAAGQSRDLGEANHGPDPFPTAPAGAAAAYDLRNAVVSAGAGDASAYGAVDMRPYTEWAARQGVAESTWLTVDLGSARPVGRVDVLPDASPEGDCAFSVGLSADGKTWRTAGSGTGRGSNQAPQWGTASFPSESARYVRVTPTRWNGSWVAVWELRVSP